MIFANKTLTIAIAAFLLLFFGLLPALQAAEFSADMEISRQGKVVATGKIFVQGELTRTEMNQNGRTITVISRPDKGLAWSLMPQAKTYMEMPMDQDKEDHYSDNLVKEMKKRGKKVGRETVNGVACDKYEFTEEGRKTTCWIGVKEELPVRINTGDSEINYRNIKVARQPKHLFRPPAGYRKFALPNMPGMPGMPPGGAGSMPGAGQR